MAFIFNTGKNGNEFGPDFPMWRNNQFCTCKTLYDLNFNRAGNMIGTPRVTYTTPDAPLDLRNTYHDAIDAALGRCTPLPFTAGMGGAVAGRPINIRFVDNRKLQ